MSRIFVALTACLMAGFLSAAHAQTFKVLYNFQGGTDGAWPSGPLIRGAAGNLYGTTQFGGGYRCWGRTGHGCGTIFGLAPDGTETVLHAFKSKAAPDSGVIADAKGNLYGSAPGFGHNCNGNYRYGCGGIFKLESDGRALAFYLFPQGGADGSGPNGLIQDQMRNFYGTTTYGGAVGGTVFKLAPDRTLTTLHVFAGGNDGAQPASALLADSAGNLFGTTSAGGGIDNCSDGHLGCGSVFKLSPDGVETVLYAFHGGTDGGVPVGALIQDQAGNLYGTTIEGGTGCSNYGCGTIFKLAPSGTETVLYRFQDGNDGANPNRALTMDVSGNLYGVAVGGGANHYGTVFELNTGGSFTVLHTFAGSDGGSPSGDLLMDGSGNLFGTTSLGGSGSCNGGCGVVFELTP